MAKSTETAELTGEQRYQQMMRQDMSEVKEPEPLPSGEWKFRCNFTSQRFNTKYEEGDENAFLATVNVGLVPIEPVANVEESEVESGAWRGGRHTKTVFIYNESHRYEVKQILGAFGIQMEGRDFLDGLELAKERSAIATVGKRTNKRTGVIENTYSNFRPVA